MKRCVFCQKTSGMTVLDSMGASCQDKSGRSG